MGVFFITFPPGAYDKRGIDTINDTFEMEFPYFEMEFPYFKMEFPVF